MTNALQFGIDLDKAFDDLLDEQFLPFKQKIAMQVLIGVTNKMPVKTGRARGNTIVSIVALNAGLSFRVDKSGSDTIERGQQEIFSDRDPFAAIFVQNNLPYINRLENGHSQKQAPLGMFALTAAEVETQFT